MFKINIASGKLIIFSITNKNLCPILEVDRKIENSMISIPINKIIFNPIYKKYLTISYEDGIVDMITLSEDFYRNSYNDIEKLKYEMNRLSGFK